MSNQPLEKQIKFKLKTKEFEEFKSLVKSKGFTMQFLLRDFVLKKTKELKGGGN